MSRYTLEKPMEPEEALRWLHQLRHEVNTRLDIPGGRPWYDMEQQSHALDVAIALMHTRPIDGVPVETERARLAKEVTRLEVELSRAYQERDHLLIEIDRTP